MVGASLRSRTPGKTAKAPSSEIVHRSRCLDRDEPKLVEHVVEQPANGSGSRKSAPDKGVILPNRRGCACTLYRDAAAARIGSGQFVLRCVAGLHGMLDSPVKMSSLGSRMRCCRSHSPSAAIQAFAGPGWFELPLSERLGRRN